MKLGRSETGQAIVEFALLLPVLVLLVIGIIEFSLVWNSRNTVLFASRDGSMLAAEGGSLDGTDCVVLQRIEGDVVDARNECVGDDVRCSQYLDVAAAAILHIDIVQEDAARGIQRHVAIGMQNRET